MRTILLDLVEGEAQAALDQVCKASVGGLTIKINVLSQEDLERCT